MERLGGSGGVVIGRMNNDEAHFIDPPMEPLRL